MTYICDVITAMHLFKALQSEDTLIPMTFMSLFTCFSTNPFELFYERLLQTCFPAKIIF